jgi:hypothetical protein
MTTTILKEFISEMTKWQSALESGPDGPLWERELRACTTCLPVLCDVVISRSIQLAEDAADQALCEKLAEKAEIAARWSKEDSAALEAAFGL